MRKTIVLLACVCGMLSHNASQAQALTAGLVCYLPIDNSLNDYGPNQYFLTGNGSLVPDRTGAAGEAYLLNGSLQTIMFPNSPLMRPQLPMSVSMYVNFNSLGGTFFANDLTPYSYTGMWIGSSGSGSIHLNFGDGGTTTSVYRRTKETLVTVAPGTWHHIVGVIRSATDMDIYIDCVDAGGYYWGDGGSMYYGMNPARIGAAAAAGLPGGMAYLNGAVDEIAFWNRALTPGDVERVCSGQLHELLPVSIAAGVSNEETLLWPLPATKLLHVKVPENAPSRTMEVLDSHGHILHAWLADSPETVDLKLEGYASGMYFLRETTEDGRSKTTSFMVQI